jgi:hypothetical protein
MADCKHRLAQNLAAVQERIKAAAGRAGRAPEVVKLVAVTKYVDASIASALADAGCVDLGESRPQDLWHKAEALRERNLRWHLIGHLQRNKVRRTLPLAELIHSVDSTRLLREIDRESAALNRRMPVLLEVNISGDPQKHGFPPDEMVEALRVAAACPHVQVQGLMGMAGREGDLAAAREQFQHLRLLRDQLRKDPEPGFDLDELSMGMSGDFEVAIEEGATMVRVGSLLFEGIP